MKISSEKWFRKKNEIRVAQLSKSQKNLNKNPKIVDSEILNMFNHDKKRELKLTLLKREILNKNKKKAHPFRTNSAFNSYSSCFFKNNSEIIDNNEEKLFIFRLNKKFN